jgi:hypothetical protein
MFCLRCCFLLHYLEQLRLISAWQIFGHLNPLDLLHLSRTTKEIRGTLRNLAAICIVLPPQTTDILMTRSAGLDCPGSPRSCSDISLAFVWKESRRNIQGYRL